MASSQRRPGAGDVAQRPRAPGPRRAAATAGTAGRSDRGGDRGRARRPRPAASTSPRRQLDLDEGGEQRLRAARASPTSSPRPRRSTAAARSGSPRRRWTRAERPAANVTVLERLEQVGRLLHPALVEAEVGEVGDGQRAVGQRALSAGPSASSSSGLGLLPATRTRTAPSRRPPGSGCSSTTGLAAHRSRMRRRTASVHSAARSTSPARSHAVSIEQKQMPRRRS